jgi:hypothetical protein
LPGEAIFANFHSKAALLNYKDVKREDPKPHDQKHCALVNVPENIQFVVNYSAIHQVEDLHQGEHIEDISQVSTRSFVSLKLAPQFTAIPIVFSPWEYKLRVPAVPKPHIWLGEEVLPSEYNGVYDYDLIDPHAQEVLEDFPRDNVIIS